MDPQKSILTGNYCPIHKENYPLTNRNFTKSEKFLAPVSLQVLPRLTWVEFFRKCISSLPKAKILDWPKLKKFEDDKINVAEMTISLSDRVENTVEKGENAGYRHLLYFPALFSEAFFFRIVKSRDCVIKS